MKILCAGDIHLGRTSSRIPGTHSNIAPASVAWQRIVEHAVGQKFGAVLLAGDIVDHSNRYFEALGPLRRGLEELARNNIYTVAVAGNHDWDVLPRLFQSLASDRCILLGGGGVWETIELQENGLPAVRVVGWSFPAQHVATSPLPPSPLHDTDGIPIVGLVHGDLDEIGSRYAYLSLAELKASPFRIWVLGHIHRPALHSGRPGPAVLNTGSLQALDPGELGCHGAWAFETSGRDAFLPRQVAVSPVRYEVLNVELDELDSIEQLAPCVQSAIDRYVATIRDEIGQVGVLSCRLRFTGRTRLHGKIQRQWIALGQNFAYELSSRGVVTISSAEFEMKPAIDLSELAALRDPVGSLARLILDLMSSDPSDRALRLIGKAASASKEIYGQDAFRPVYANDVQSEGGLRDAIIRQAYSTIDALLEQKAAV